MKEQKIKIVCYITKKYVSSFMIYKGKLHFLKPSFGIYNGKIRSWKHSFTKYNKKAFLEA